MYDLSQTLKYSELLNRPVVDRQTVKDLGGLAKLLVDSQAQRIVGLVAKSGMFGSKKYVCSWEQIEAIGNDSILVRSTERSDLEGSKLPEAPIGFQILTNQGNKMGQITDLLFEARSGEITGYLFSPEGWKGLIEGTYILAPIAISSLGEKRVIVLESAVAQPRQYTPGIADKLDRATELIQTDYERTKQDIADVQKGAKSIADRVKGIAESATQKVDETVSDLKNRLPDKDP